MPAIEIVARVRFIDREGGRAHLELKNGNYVLIDLNDLDADDQLSLGEVVLLDDQLEFSEGNVDRALWSTDCMIGVVKHRDDERTLIEVNGSLRRVPPASTVSYAVGNTVEADSLWGVTGIVSEQALSLLDEYLSRNTSTQRSFLYVPPDGEKETFKSFGGHPDVVERTRKLIQVPLKSAAQLAHIGARSLKGVLFTGDPGSGKTMLARIIANENDAAFLSIDGPEIFSKWVGESEEAVRAIFEEATAHDRAIIFFDEIDSLATRRENDSHESGRRVLAQLLTRMDGLRPGDGTVVIATTNRAGDIDPALLRAGRFDWIIDFPPPNEADRLDILQKSGARIVKAGGIPLARTAARTDHWSAAELAQIWAEAAYFAAEEERWAVNEEDFLRAYQQVANQRSERPYPDGPSDKS